MILFNNIALKNIDKIPMMLKEVIGEKGSQDAIKGNRGLQFAAIESLDNRIS
jgi:hypothetical protein